MCYHIVSDMTAFQKEAMGSTRKKSQTMFPLSVVHALYKFKEYFTPVSRKDRVYELVDESLLCTRCKVYPIYRPCNTSRKRRVVDNYGKQCLQCYITSGIANRSGTIYEYVALNLAYETTLVDCKCHGHTLLLMFPACIMFASEFSLKFLIREQIMDILSVYYHTKDPIATQIRIQSASNAHHKLRRRHIDAHYLKSLVADSLADHFMLCTGPCVGMRMTLRQSGASSRTSQFMSMLTSIIGISQHQDHPPHPYQDDTTAVTRRRDEGELYLQRLKYSIHQHTQQWWEDIYCPSCSCHIDTLLMNLPRICKLDSLYEIGKRCGPYTVTHIDKYAPAAASEEEEAECRRPHKRQRK